MSKRKSELVSECVCVYAFVCKRERERERERREAGECVPVDVE